MNPLYYLDNYLVDCWEERCGESSQREIIFQVLAGIKELGLILAKLRYG